MKNKITALLTICTPGLMILSCSLGLKGKKDIEINYSKDHLVNEIHLEKLQTKIEENIFQNIHSLIIIKDDKIVTEQYFNGFKKNDLHYSASVTKSFASTLLGIAIDKGYFNDDIDEVLHSPLIKFFPEYEEILLKDSLKQKITLTHLLTMTAGFEWDEHTYPYTDRRNDCNKINHSDNPMKFLLERNMQYSPGERFYYNGGLSLTISFLIEKCANLEFENFTEEFLFEPLGIKKYLWTNVENGLKDSNGGLHLRPIDQAKLGSLFLNNGMWNDKQIISEEWVARATEMTVKNDDMPDYGFQWWGGVFYAQNKAYDIYMASGHGGQKVVVVPEYNTVIQISQQVFNNPNGDLNFIAMMSDYILPALVNEKNKYEKIENKQVDLSKYSGEYVISAESSFLNISQGEGCLHAIAHDGMEFQLIPVTDRIFKADLMNLFDLYFEFMLDEKGKPRQVVSRIGFREKVFTKV